MTNEIIIFENQDVKLDVNLKDDTVWLTQAQIAHLFKKNRKTITRHIQNIYKEGEIEENSVCLLFEHTATDGKVYNVQFYNILSKKGKQVIDNNTLVALTLLIVQSNPKEKNLTIDLVMNFLE